MFSIGKIIFLYGSLLSVLASGLLLGSMMYNPRLWLQDYPRDVQERVPPKTKAEKRQSLFVGIPFLVLLFLIPTLGNVALRRSFGEIGFFQAVMNALGILLFFNAFDWLVLDWLILCSITPGFMVIPGTQGMQGYKNYVMHFKGFLLGSAFSVAGAFLVSLITILIL